MVRHVTTKQPAMQTQFAAFVKKKGLAEQWLKRFHTQSLDEKIRKSGSIVVYPVWVAFQHGLLPYPAVL